MGRRFEVELVFHEGDAGLVVCLDFREETKDDGDKPKVHLGGVDARVRDGLGKALLPIVAGGVLLGDIVSYRDGAGEGVAALSLGGFLVSEQVGRDVGCGRGDEPKTPWFRGGRGDKR